MSWLVSWLRRKKPQNRPHLFTDDERDTAEITRLRQSIREQEKRALRERLEHLKEMREKQLMQQQIEELEDDVYGGDEEDQEEDPVTDEPGIEAMFFNLIKNAQKANQQKPPMTEMPTQAQRRHFPNEELTAMFSRVPDEYKKQLKKMSDDEILTQIRTQAPDFFFQADEDSIARAVQLVRA